MIINPTVLLPETEKLRYLVLKLNYRRINLDFKKKYIALVVTNTC